MDPSIRLLAEAEQMRIFFILFILLLSGASQAAPDALNEALRAEEAGDDAKAATLFLPLATKGDPVAQYNLGILYTRGLSIQKDYRAAVQWYLAAAEQGNAGAEANLAQLYENGEGVAQDYKKAMQWSTLAARQGDSSAQLHIGQMYAAGLGVPQDYKEAIKWYRLAADQGNAIASARLGECYENGLGVAQDGVMAVKWYGTAANNSSDVNSRNTYLARRAVLEKDITSRQIAAEQARLEDERVQTESLARAEAARIVAEQVTINRVVEDEKLKVAAQAAFDAKVQAQKLADVKKELADVEKELARVKAEAGGRKASRRSRLENEMARRRAEINAEAARRRREILAADKHAKSMKTAKTKQLVKPDVPVREHPLTTAITAAAETKQPIKPEAPVREHTSLIKPEPAKATQGTAVVGQRQVSGKISVNDKTRYPAKVELTDEELKHPLIRELQPSAGSIPGKPLIKIKQIEWSKKQEDSR